MTTIVDRRARSRWGRWISVGIALGAASAAAAPDAPKPKLTLPAELPRCVDAWGPEPCLQALHEYVQARPDQAFEAGKLATKVFAHWAAIPFFDLALSARADAARCKDERLTLSVVSALKQPNDDESRAVVASATNILRDRCWKELREPIVREIEKDGRGTLTRNVCHIFIEKTFTDKSQALPACWTGTKLATPRAGAPAWEALDPKKIELEGAASVYSGADGRRITIAKIKGKPYYLIKFQNFRGPWNGKVVVHRQDAAGSGHDYWMPIDGRRYVSVVVRKPSGAAALWEVHALGSKGSLRVTLDPAATKATKAQTLLTELTLARPDEGR